ncbi:Na+/H+ antiporter NhaA [Bosea sp. NBC_00550]|uniref:Na+/H+ antiporter NhaA n=1 Tax=Bosea sp. NBC_00550 TaxID=2969621 RepID=UPI0022309654|nr:Na+/H+ antiporter NhaA [Bosea sp. NBC_00550]UZF91913.1 Na+/H+ antiporter NhaA [Bosea sp. NBC_00550]
MAGPAARTRPLSALREFLHSEASGGIVLMAVAALAVVIANSPAAPFYFAALKSYVLGLSVLHWINDALMAVFFLLVGLEIKREMLDGQLSSWGRRALPGFAALGGMVAPALIYVALNRGAPESLRGWAIPTATDIAFALGVLSLLGPRVPASLKVFLTALAILDDLGAVIIIAVFYTSGLSELYLGLAALTLIALAVLNRLGVTRLAPYLLLGIALWIFTLKSGVHATLAGVALALTIPLKASPARPDDAGSPLHRLEHGLHPYVAFLIIPIFGFANAGLPFSGLGLATLAEPLPLGILLGLFVGKQIGIFGFGWLAIRAGLADLPARASWAQFYGIALLCGIGFTMSLFIGLLAFPDSEMLQNQTKMGVIAGSLISGIGGWLLLRFSAGEDMHRKQG